MAGRMGRPPTHSPRTRAIITAGVAAGMSWRQILGELVAAGEPALTEDQINGQRNEVKKRLNKAVEEVHASRAELTEIAEEVAHAIDVLKAMLDRTMARIDGSVAAEQEKLERLREIARS